MIETILAAILFVPASGLDTARIERLTGVKGSLDEEAGVFRVAVPRRDLAVTAAGVRLTPPLGLTSWAAFQRLRRAGILVVAIHHHMTHEEPRILFLHYWGIGPTEDLARGLRAALDKTKHN